MTHSTRMGDFADRDMIAGSPALNTEPRTKEKAAFDLALAALTHLSQRVDIGWVRAYAGGRLNQIATILGTEKKDER